MIQVTVRLRNAEILAQKQINDAMKRAMWSLGLRWKVTYLEKHFTHRGAREYGYQPRKGEPGSDRKFKGSYTAQKLAKFKHTNPLVWSGDLRAEALEGNGKIRVTSTSKETTVYLSMPRKANWKHPKSQVHPIEELRKVSEAELATMEVWLTEYVEAELKKEGAVRATAGVQLSNVA